MQQEELMLTSEICRLYQVDDSFIRSLEEFGLIRVEIIENRAFLHKDGLDLLEKFIRLHYDLNINFEGLDAINNLLVTMSRMQEELRQLRNRLNQYELTGSAPDYTAE